jgi:hypothetical protein
MVYQDLGSGSWLANMRCRWACQRCLSSPGSAAAATEQPPQCRDPAHSPLKIIVEGIEARLACVCDCAIWRDFGLSGRAWLHAMLYGGRTNCPFPGNDAADEQLAAGPSWVRSTSQSTKCTKLAVSPGCESLYMSETTFHRILVSAAIKDCSVLVSFQSCEGEVPRSNHAFSSAWSCSVCKLLQALLCSRGERRIVDKPKHSQAAGKGS